MSNDLNNTSLIKNGGLTFLFHEIKILVFQ